MKGPGALPATCFLRPCAAWMNNCVGFRNSATSSALVRCIFESRRCQLLS